MARRRAAISAIVDLLIADALVLFSAFRMCYLLKSNWFGFVTNEWQDESNKIQFLLSFKQPPASETVYTVASDEWFTYPSTEVDTQICRVKLILI